MARTLTLLKASICLVLCVFVGSVAVAQPNTTPGLPWTYVTPDSLPVEAIDTAFDNSILRNDQDSASNIRWIYRINCHVRLTEVTDSNTFFIEVPRHPDSFGLIETVERIEMANPFIEEIITASSNSFFLGSSASRSHPHYSFPALEFDEDIRLNSAGDTIQTLYFGSLVRMPQFNVIVENRNDTAFRSYAYFLQYIDSIWFPAISSLETPKGASSFNAYPNPTVGKFSIEMPAEASTNVDGYIMRIYDPTAKLLDTRRVRSNEALQHLELPQGGVPGTYTITLYDERGRLAVGRIMKLE